MKCVARSCDNASTNTVPAWSVPINPQIIDVPVCNDHFLCETCHKSMEVSPISDDVECFLHGPRKTPAVHT